MLFSALSFSPLPSPPFEAGQTHRWDDPFMIAVDSLAGNAAREPTEESRKGARPTLTVSGKGRAGFRGRPASAHAVRPNERPSSVSATPFILLMPRVS
jgi:hypothetical protein